jgi:hypothetical protein
MAHTARIAAPLSRRKLAMVLKSGARRPVSHISSTLRGASRSSRRLHYAEPLKGWGDALARQDHWGDVLAKYDEVLKYAPAWKELHQARDAAARRAG